MKLQIDTDNKVIKVEDKVNLGEFIKALDRLFPAKAWREFSLDTNVEIKWSSPFVIPYRDVYPTYPTYPWITYTTGDHPTPYRIDYNSGTYCVDMQVSDKVAEGNVNG